MSPRALIFDCDGTLVDSESLGAEVLAELLGELGVRIDPVAAARRYRGRRMAETLQALGDELQVRLPADFGATLRARAAVAFAARLRPAPAAAALLAALPAGLPRAVASNGPREQTLASLRITGLLRHFGEHVYSAYDVGAWKPAPDLFLHAAAALGARPADCLVIEDSAPGVTAARAAGMAVIAVGDAHGLDGVATIGTLAELPARCGWPGGGPWRGD